MEIKKILRSCLVHQVLAVFIGTLFFLPPSFASEDSKKSAPTKKSGADAAGKSSKRTSKAKSNKSKKSGNAKNSSAAAMSEESPSSSDEDAATQKSKITILGALGYSLAEKSLVGGGSIGTLKGTGSGVDLGFTMVKGNSGVMLVEKTHVGLRYRSGIAKIAYLGGGLGYSRFKGSWNSLSSDESSELTVFSTVKAITFDAGFGFRLPLGVILVGADLVDISVPISKMGLVPADTKDPIFADDTKVQQAAFGKYAGGVAVESKLTLGFAF
jgi:hypothetical protein